MTFTPRLHGQAVEGAAGDVLRISSAAAPVTRRVGKQPLADVDEALLGPVGDEARIGAVLEDGRGAWPAPGGDQAADVHVPPVERLFGGMFPLGAGVGVPSSTEVLI